MSSPAFTLPAQSGVGRVALRVASLDRIVPFYEVVGFDVSYDEDRAVLSAGTTPLVVLDEDTDAPARAGDETGLFHLAVRVPGRAALGDALVRIEGSNVEASRLTGASDHLVSEALYLRDPEGNGVEIYTDRPRAEWQMNDERVEIDTLPLELDSLREAAGGGDALDEGTDIGHVHLEVSSLSEARGFYVDTLGFTVRNESYQGALFVAAGDYHHHVGLNTWNGRTEPMRQSRGLEWFEVCAPPESVADLRAALGERATELDEGFSVPDPDGIEIRVRPTE